MALRSGFSNEWSQYAFGKSWDDFITSQTQYEAEIAVEVAKNMVNDDACFTGQILVTHCAVQIEF